MVTAWVYDDKYMSEDFNYEDLEKKYVDQEMSRSDAKASSLKEALDQKHSQ